MDHKSLFGWIFTAVTLVALVILVAIVLDKVDDFERKLEQSTTQPATDTWREPYGGCKEAAANPGTPGYEQCAARGLVP